MEQNREHTNSVPLKLKLGSYNILQLTRGKTFSWQNENTTLIPQCMTRKHYKRKTKSPLAYFIPKVWAEEQVEENASVTKNPEISEDIEQPKSKVIVTDIEVQDYLQSETGKDRLKALYSRDAKGNLHPDIYLISNTVKSAGSIAFLIAALFGGRYAKDEFVRKNMHTKFTTKFRAMRSYRDAIFMGSIKFGFQMCVKVGFFTTLFMLTSTTVATYRNKSSIVEYCAGGAVTAAILRSSLGLRGIVGGGVIGGAMGTVGGILIFGILHMNNETQEQRHYYNTHELVRERKEMQMLSEGSS